jgi:SAM-dependent methyltransferase
VWLSDDGESRKASVRIFVKDSEAVAHADSEARPEGRRYQLDPSPYGVHAKVLDFVVPGWRVLDIGCASGYLAEKLKEKGCRVWGVEIDERDAELARAHCVEVLTADIEALDTLPWPTRSFDLVLCLDVLEHLRDPWRALRMLRSYLRVSDPVPSQASQTSSLSHPRPLWARGKESTTRPHPPGVLVVSLPNVANWWVRLQLLSGRFDYRPAGILDHTHLRFFTRRSAERLLTESGYNVTHWDVTPGVASNIYLRTLGRALDLLGVRGALEYSLTRHLPGLFALTFVFVARPAMEP